MQSAMPSGFTGVPTVDIPRSTFNRTHGYKTTFNAGYLIPFYCDEVLPGDTFNLQATLFARLATPLFPIMDNMYLDTQFFFCPSRLVWDDFKSFMGEKDIGDTSTYLVPVLDSATYPATGFLISSIYDYMGLPVLIPTGGGVTAPNYINALPFRAYNQIYNFWYRDENLQSEITVSTDNGPDAVTDYTVLRRNKKMDYFTGSLPFPQKSSTVPNVGSNFPIYGSGTVPVLGIGKFTQTPTNTNTPVYDSASLNPTYAYSSQIASGGSADNNFYIKTKGAAPTYPDINADLTNGTMYGIVSELRTAVQIQRFYEQDARGGTRYSELVRSHFGVTFPAPIDRPEYLGGSTDIVNITPVPQTSVTAATPQGNLAGYGTAFTKPRFVKSFNEHGYIIGILSVRCDLNYQQNIDRMWFRSTKFDFYWPTFAHLSEQPVLNREISTSFTSGDNGVFGYQERYADYRYKPSLITGLFRSQAAGTLDSWHLADDFSPRPSLNPTFIQVNPPMSRIKAVPAEPDFILYSVINLKCARPMPITSVPGLMDHF